MDRRYIYIFLVTSLVIVLDQITKLYIINNVKPFESIEVFPFLHIVNVKNKGGAFGMFKDAGNALFVVVSLIAIIFIILLLIRSKEGYLGFSLILGGAIGNLVDRLHYGWVVDFIDFSIGRFHWPAFNVADSALTIGVIIILLVHFFKSDTIEERKS
ncbi:MAG: signal peptidase II [Thermodesulfovibrionales bacterium]